MQLCEIFTICTVTIIHDTILNISNVLLSDICTGMPLVFEPEILESITDSLAQIEQQTGEYPSTVGILGHLDYYEDSVWVTEFEAMIWYNMKVTTCYIEKVSENGFALYDEDTYLPVEVAINNDFAYNSINTVLRCLINTPNTDYSIDGDNRIAIFGDMTVDNGEAIIYSYDSKFFINTPESTVKQLFNKINFNL